MLFGGITGKVWTVATTTYGIGVGAVVIILVSCWIIVRWREVKTWVEDRIQGRQEVKLKTIFDQYLDKVATIKDRRELYAEILKIVSSLARSNDISILIKSSASNQYVVRESIGSKPMSFHVGALDQFIKWICEYRRSITRAELVESANFKDVKTPGLQYCVQFHAEAVIPLVLASDLVGIINIGSREDGADFENKLFEVFDLMSSQFAVAIHNANLHEGLNRQNVELKQLDSLKTQLLANVSHELRTPLNSIIGLSEVMIEGGDGVMSVEQKNHLEMIRDSGKRLLDTVTQLLDLSKLEANKLALNIKRINLSKMIADAETALLKKDNVSVDSFVDDKTPTVYGDAEWLSRVCKNLLHNAMKYTNEGSIKIDCDKAGEMLKVGIHDTGIGINKEEQKNIFDGFHQASNGVSRDHEGTGLGLAITKKIVELHGGRIWLDSAPGKGSHFFFTLPLKPTSIPSTEIRPYKVNKL